MRHYHHTSQTNTKNNTYLDVTGRTTYDIHLGIKGHVRIIGTNINDGIQRHHGHFSGYQIQTTGHNIFKRSHIPTLRQGQFVHALDIIAGIGKVNQKLDRSITIIIFLDGGGPHKIGTLHSRVTYGNTIERDTSGTRSWRKGSSIAIGRRCGGRGTCPSA